MKDYRFDNGHYIDSSINNYMPQTDVFEFDNKREFNSKSSSFSLIPFASGSPVLLTTKQDGSPDTYSFIGFGNSARGIPMIDGVINLTNLSGGVSNFAFSVPKTCTINAISAFFSTTLTLSLIDSYVEIRASLYQAKGLENNFRLIPESVVSLQPVFTSVVLMGSTSFGNSSNLDISIEPSTRLLLVFSARSSGKILANSVVGYASAGIALS